MIAQLAEPRHDRLRAGPPPTGAASPRAGISRRASRSWWRTRNWRKPSARTKASASSTWRSFSAVIGSPYWKREDRQAKAGLSQVGRPSARERSRISAFHSSASISGARTPVLGAPPSCPAGGRRDRPWWRRTTSVPAPSRWAIGRAARRARPCRRSSGWARCARTRGWSSSWVRDDHVAQADAARRAAAPPRARARGRSRNPRSPARARSPSASLAARASSVESTPPEKATTTRSSSRSRSSKAIVLRLRSWAHARSRRMRSSNSA